MLPASSVQDLLRKTFVFIDPLVLFHLAECLYILLVEDPNIFGIVECGLSLLLSVIIDMQDAPSSSFDRKGYRLCSSSKLFRHGVVFDLLVAEKSVQVVVFRCEIGFL
jgi:hypothetical protein